METIKGVYVLTFPNGKRYVGKSCSKEGVYSRWVKYKRCNCKDQPKLYNALLKYGPLNVKYEIVIKCDDDTKARRIEQQLIALWGLQNDKHGYNIGMGGEKDQLGLKRSNETKIKNGIASKGNQYRLGKYHSDETKLKISKSHKGRPSANKGKKFSKEFGEKISKIRLKMLEDGTIEKTNKGSFKKGSIPWNKKVK